MALKLIKLTKEYEKQLGEMIDEWILDQEINHTNRSPWAIFKNDYHDFDYYLEHLELKKLRKAWFQIQYSSCWTKPETDCLGQ